MVRQIRLLGLLAVLSQAACSSSLFEGSGRTEAQEKSAEQIPAEADAVKHEPLANEPVAIGGGFLVCVSLDADQVSFGCRIEDENHEKISIDGLKRDDVTAFSADQQILPVKFQLADADELWHWLADDDEAAEVAYVRLSDRFVADAGAPALESLILNEAPKDFSELLSDELQAEFNPNIIGMPPGPSDIERIADNQVIAGEYNWYHGEPGYSCNQVCEERGGLLETVTATWVRNQFFCGNLFRVMQPDTQLKEISLSILPSMLGCFTFEVQVGTVFIDHSNITMNGDARASGVRRYCSCAS